MLTRPHSPRRQLAQDPALLLTAATMTRRALPSPTPLLCQRTLLHRLHTLPHADKAFLDAIDYRKKLQAIDAAILTNADFFA